MRYILALMVLGKSLVIGIGRYRVRHKTSCVILMGNPRQGGHSGKSTTYPLKEFEFWLICFFTNFTTVFIALDEGTLALHCSHFSSQFGDWFVGKSVWVRCKLALGRHDAVMSKGMTC